MSSSFEEYIAPPVIGLNSERAVQISGRCAVGKERLPMLKEDRDYLLSNGWQETPDGWEKCRK